MDDNLSEAFGTPARAQLGGLLPRRSSAPTKPTAPAVNQPPAQEPSRVPEATADQANLDDSEDHHAVAERAPVDADAITTTQVSVYLTPAAINAARRARGNWRTNADVALDAIDATVDRLPALLAGRRTGPEKPGSLFPARRRLRTDTEPRVLWSMKASQAELAVIDRLVGTTGARSRSELIATAIEAHLLRPRRRK